MLEIPLVLLPSEEQLAQLIDPAIESGDAGRIALLRDILTKSHDVALGEVGKAAQFVESLTLRSEIMPVDQMRDSQERDEAIRRANERRDAIERNLNAIAEALERLNVAFASIRA